MKLPEFERAQAGEKALDSLSRYKFQMFGYWAAIWVHMNRLCDDPLPNLFSDIVKLAKKIKEGEPR